ncbi:MAG: ATP-dependent RecD-like DNA helicase [Candidatus Izemoplasmataceae bacterium]
MEYIEGTIRTITFYSEDNAFAIVKVDVSDRSDGHTLFSMEKQDRETIKGTLPNPKKGETFRFYGEYEQHPTYGRQFRCETFEKLEETNEEGLIEYLSSDKFPGVGERTAGRIVKTLGKDAIQKIMKDPSVLREVPKLKKNLQDTLVENLRDNKADEQTLIKLYGYDISPKIAMRILKVYKERSLEVLKENPYRLIDEVEGIGFERADEIARSLGFEADHPARIRAMIVTLFTHIAMARGHTYVDKEWFMSTAFKRLSNTEETIEEALVEEALSSLIEEGRFIEEEGGISLRSLVRSEEAISERIHALTQGLFTIDEKKVKGLIHDFEQKEGIRYTGEQKKAILETMRHQSMILTGGPGTGKTTVIKGVVHAFYHYHGIERPSYHEESAIHLIAPTGRAAKRMQETTGYYATTIHRFLGYGFDGSFAYGRNFPRQGRLFVVDEASMIDTALAAKLFESLEDDARVLIVGDEAQLPSVGPGQVLKDLIDSGIMQTVTLAAIHRQGPDSHIIDLANAIRKGRLPKDIGKPYEDRYLVSERENAFKDRLKRIIDHFIDQGYDLFDDIQVLIPMYKGEAGIHSVNRFLQETYNPNDSKSIIHQGRTFRLFDKILQLTNQVEDGVMNGDQGQITGIDEAKGIVYATFMEREVAYKKRDLENITHAYAMSIHKSQGSEYSVVILPLFPSYTIMLRRKLIYTAITRAQAKLVILGEVNLLKRAIGNLEEDRRTRLKEKLQARLDGREKTMDDILAAFDQDQEKADEKRITDPDIPFETLGEDIGELSPYDFMDDE